MAEKQTPMDVRGSQRLEFCRIESDGRILTVTIDRPEVLNAIHRDAHFELSRVFDAFAGDHALRLGR